MEKEFDYMENNQWNDFTVDINGSGSFYLKFWSKGNRFFLDEVVIRKLGQSAGIHNLRMTSSQPSQRKYYRLDGVFVGNDFNTLPSGIYICNGKKIVKWLCQMIVFVAGKTDQNNILWLAFIFKHNKKQLLKSACLKDFSGVDCYDKLLSFRSPCDRASRWSLSARDQPLDHDSRCDSDSH